MVPTSNKMSPALGEGFAVVVIGTFPIQRYGLRQAMRQRRCLPVTASGSQLAVDHPWDAELIDQHAKTLGKEGLLERHLHRPILRQRAEDTFRIGRSIDTD
jgi:hypothetical protein